MFAKLDEIWDNFFPDMPQNNEVKIVWGRKARNRLGSIKPGQVVKGMPPETIITINSLFRDQIIPEYVIVGTIAHELAHYAHGFHSPLDRKFPTPHAGGVVSHELQNRGLAKVLKMQKTWLKENWENYLAEKYPRSRRRRRSRVYLKWF